MKRRASFPLKSIWVVMALAGWQLAGAPGVLAQQQAAPPQATAPAPAAPQGPLDERIIRLEQRILDMQTVIGTLQSFVREGGGVPSQGGLPSTTGEGVGGISPGGGPSELSIRVLALETQIKALTAQMEQVASRLDQINSGPGAQPLQGGVPPLAQDQQFGAPPLGDPLGQLQGQLQGQAQPPRAFGSPRDPAPEQGAPGFSTSTAGPRPQSPFADPGPVPQAQPGLQVPPGQSASQPPQARAGLQPPPQPFSPDSVPGAGVPGAPGAGGGPSAVYDASYESFLRSDFQRAGIGFQNFVKTFPDDKLTGNAYYWLGRTHYARKQYEPAAKAFLAGYKRGKKTPIAPDALLYLGMSLGAMGEKEAACSTLGAISKQFPDAPQTLKQDVNEAFKRTRC